MVKLLFLSLPGLVLCAQTSIIKDSHCSTPPGATAPVLKGRILPGQGDVNFTITTNHPQAQRFFNQGVAQMHSFWSNEAERSFLQAAEFDPNAPMPWWGVAMVAAGDFRPRFQLETYGDQLPYKKKDWPPRAVEAAEKARKLSANGSALERMYIEAVYARRDAKLDDPEEAYTQKLREIVALYPNEIEARTYLALHLMRGYVLPEKTPRSTTMEAVALLRQLMKDAPDHPGVHHYVIHGFEGSTFAKEAWHSCERYPELSPNIPHALHMPGHIYSQTGRWEDAARSFELAAANERYWLKEDPLASASHHGHNVHYLATAYSFHGEFDKAAKAARELLTYTESAKEKETADGPRIPWRQGWFALMRSVVQNERWPELATLPEHDKPRTRAWRAWAAGIASATQGDATTARSHMAEMDGALADLGKAIQRVPAELRIAREELDGHIAIAAGRTSEGLKTLEAAAGRERHLVYMEPPQYPRPVNEALGRAALKAGQLDMAERAFRGALEQYPESTAAKLGLEEAHRRAAKPASPAGAF